MGSFQERPDLLRKAAAYLDKHAQDGCGSTNTSHPEGRAQEASDA